MMSETQAGEHRRRNWWQCILWAIFSALLWIIPGGEQRLGPGMTRVRWTCVGLHFLHFNDMAKVILTVLRPRIPLRLPQHKET
jgi:hypothetical protein